MWLFDYVILGLYFIIRPIYRLLNITERPIEAEDHSFLISWTAHSANIIQIISFFFKETRIYKTTVIISIITLLISGYYIYYSNSRILNILNIKYSLAMKFFISIISLLYVFISYYLYFR